MFQAGLDKITKTKRVGGVAQIVECLLSKCEALTSNPVPPLKYLMSIFTDTEKLILKFIWKHKRP
jgi:hypothetical protein